MEDEWIRGVCLSLPLLSSGLCSSAQEVGKACFLILRHLVIRWSAETTEGLPTQALAPSGASGEEAHSVLALYHLRLFNMPVSELHGNR